MNGEHSEAHIMALIETNSIAVPAEAGHASGLVSEIKGFWKRFFATQQAW